MESEFLVSIKEISLEAFIVAILVFGFTMLIKWPIKRLTARLEENKRKAVNTIIVFIPMLISLILNALYFGIFKSQWFSSIVFDSMGTSYLIAVGIYAVFTRIIIIIKGAKNAKKEEKLQISEGQSQTSEGQSQISKDAMRYIKNSIKTVSKALKIDEEKMNGIIQKIDKLLILKDEITKNVLLQDISATEDINNQIYNLNIEKEKIQTEILKNQSELDTYKETLIKKGG